MMSQVTTYQKIHLPKGAEIQWGGPQLLPEGPWTVTLEIQKFPNGGASTTFFGTEEQMKAIAKGCDGFPEEEATPDPAQLDALEEVGDAPATARQLRIIELRSQVRVCSDQDSLGVLLAELGPLVKEEEAAGTPAPEPLSRRTDMVDLATRAVGLGVVKSW